MDDEVLSLSHRILKWGLILSLVVSIGGATFYLGVHGLKQADYTQFVPPSSALSTKEGILIGASHLQSVEIMQLGVLILMLVPITRVFFCGIIYAKYKNKLFILFSLIVFLLLFYGLT